MQESGGTYLETIYLLQKEGAFIEVAKNGVITLTKSGQKKAKELSDNGDLIVKFLMMTADISAEVAEKEASKMKHFIQNETIKGIKSFIKQVEEYEA